MSAFADLVRFNPVAGGTTDWVVSSAVGGCQTPALANVQNGVSYKVYAVSNDLTQWEVSQGVYNSGTTTFPRTTVLYNSSGTGTATGQSGAGTKINFSTIPQVSLVALAEDLANSSMAPTTQSLTSGTGATYTTGTQNGQRATWIEVFMVGGGGGGSGVSSSANTFVAASNGTTSTFNSINAAAGNGATGTAAASLVPGSGGSGGTGSATRRQQGGPGGGGFSNASIGLSGLGAGGASYFSSGTVGPPANTTVGTSGAANSGAGGGSGSNNSGANSQIGCGGGGGEFVYLLITNPSATYTYTIGPGGPGGVSTTNGGAGGSGFIFVIEHYGS